MSIKPYLLSAAILPALALAVAPAVSEPTRSAQGAIQRAAPLPAGANAVRVKAPQVPATQVPAMQAPAPQGPTSSTPKAPAPAASAADRNAVIARMSATLSATKTARGTFTQTDPGDPRADAAGRFYISRPGKVRFEYATPEPMFIISDGVSLSVEEPKRKSYDAIPLKSHPLNLFLKSNIDLKRDGAVRDVTASGGSWFVTLVDSTGEAEGRMVLEFRASDFALLGWRVIDAAGAETRTRLAGVETNVKLQPALFVVRDPADRRDDRRDERR